MWDWISEAVGGLGSLFGGGAEVAAPLMGASEYVGDLPLDFGIPDWAAGYSDTLAGGVPSMAQLSQLERAGSSGAADLIARMSSDVAAGGQPSPKDLAGLYENFGIPFSSSDLGLSGAQTFGAKDLRSGSGLLDNLSRSGGGGGNVGFSMPKIDAGGAASVGAHPVSPMQTGAIPNTPPPSSEFRPMTLETPRRAPDLRGLEKLFSRGA